MQVNYKVYIIYVNYDINEIYIYSIGTDKYYELII